jgi:DNA topoisomerase-1
LSIIARIYPGKSFFSNIDEGGQRRTISSSDVNNYLREVTREDFTAKDFRTWAGTVLAAGVLREIRYFDTKAHAKRNIISAIETVAKRLGNTRSVCRKCYIHPAVIDAYIDGSLPDTLRKKVNRQTAQSADKLSPDELAVMMILDRQSKREAKRKAA